MKSKLTLLTGCWLVSLLCNACLFAELGGGGRFPVKGEDTPKPELAFVLGLAVEIPYGQSWGLDRGLSDANAWRGVRLGVGSGGVWTALPNQIQGSALLAGPLNLNLDVTFLARPAYVLRASGKFELPGIVMSGEEGSAYGGFLGLTCLLPLDSEDAELPEAAFYVVLGVNAVASQFEQQEFFGIGPHLRIGLEYDLFGSLVDATKDGFN